MPLYLGLDSSTQSIKALVADTETGNILALQSVHFGTDLPAYGCPDGVLDHPDPLVKHTPPSLWLAALDLVLERLRDSGVPMDRIEALSGAGQQHGSVYLHAAADGVLAALDPGRSLEEQFRGVFSRATSPIWMDSSTAEECAELEASLGSRVREMTGSPAVERFTGPQIRRFHKTEPDAYISTARIHLVSSFLCSVLIGGHAPVDTGDGSGMNLLNLHTGDWDEGILQATAPGLREKLPAVRRPDSIAGGLAPYFAKFGLRPGIPVVTWTGDNPSSLIGMGAARPGVAVVSLGTSDTFFAAMPGMKTDPAGYGHVFGNPAGGAMSLICFKNGSLARDRMRAESGADWNDFSSSEHRAGVQGADGNLLLPYYIPEITPRVLDAGVRASGSADFLAGPDPTPRLRATMEGQACSMRLHSEWIGSFDTVRVTGGASRNDGLLQILADVFQAEVQTISVVDASALGAALRAAHTSAGIPWDYLSHLFAATVRSVHPQPDLREKYATALDRYRDLLASL